MKILPYMFSEACGFEPGCLLEIKLYNGKTVYGNFMRELTVNTAGIQLGDYSIYYADDIENIRPLDSNLSYWNLAAAGEHEAAISDEYGITWLDIDSDGAIVDDYGTEYDSDRYPITLRPWWALNE